MPIRLDSLTPNPDNPRTITLKALIRLSDSLKRDSAFMRLRPMIVDDTGLLLAGNQRYRALRDLGYEEVPDEWVTVARDLTPEQRARLVILDNGPEGSAGHWNVDVLLADWAPTELGELGMDLTRYGLPDLSHLPGHLGDGIAPPAPPREPEVWKSLRVHFKSRREMEDFNRITGLSVTEETSAIRFD